MEKAPLNMTLRVRITDDDHEKLQQIAAAYRVDSVSQVIRTIIRETADRLFVLPSLRPQEPDNA